jgi:phosphatidylserine/phosphatidylglycerophosphate/cardiolipin synthase-like enzyme
VTGGLDDLSAEELRRLAAALNGGRLSTPLTQLALAPYLGRSSGKVAPTLVTLTAEGLSSDHLVFFLQTLVAERESRSRRDGGVELVTTGPDPAGLPARDTRIVVRELFRQAERSVIVAGYAVYQGRDVFLTLAERMDERPDLAVRMFLDVQRRHGDTSRASDILQRFAFRFRSQEWPGVRLPEVYYDPRSLEFESGKRASLHAKCVVVDEQVTFISSANFTEAAQVRNIEVGTLIRSEPFARQLAGRFLSLAEQQVLQRVPGI